MDHRGTATRRVVLTMTTTVALAAGAMIAPTMVTAAPLAGSADSSKIDAALATTLAQGPTAFWVRFADRADLSAAAAISDWDARGQAVYDALNRTADASQAAVRRYLDSQDVSYKAYWAVNAVWVDAGTASLAGSLAGFADVSGITAPMEVELIEPVESHLTTSVGPAAPEWGIQNVRADDVWSQLDVDGSGIVVANIDTGVQYNHPALVDQYRGSKRRGFNHNYNWFNAYGSSSSPFDNNGHGTHTMGTMVGDDGGSNQIGMAPGAKWIATNGCCGSEQGLVESGQWTLAPTKLNGTKPKPGKRPDIVNNSWGYNDPGGQQTLFDQIISAWDAAGVFGQWSNGNMGPSCDTGGAPGNRPRAYSAGAYDINNTIASFSSRGPGQSGDIKPNISAPGVNVRSSFPGNQYGEISGTSMASPHVAGAVALLWSASRDLRGDVPATKRALDDTATDTSGGCGGNTDDNNTYGEGRLNAFDLVQDALAASTVVAPPAGAPSVTSTLGR